MSRRLHRRRFLVVATRAVAALLATPALVLAQETARAIHHATRNTSWGAVGVRLRRMFGDRPQPFKDYPDARRTALPEPESAPTRSLDAVLRGYQPAPALARRPISLARLTRLLEAANGVTGRGPGGIRLRAAPSAGALYAGEIYVVAEHVEGLAPGVYYYAPLSRELALLREGPHLATVTGALEEPGRAHEAAVAVLVTSVFPRYRHRYANRGYRYALVDAGHIGQNLRLATASAGLADASPLRFHDARLNGLLEIDGLDEAVCTVHLLGARADEPPSTGGKRHFVQAGAVGRPVPDAADDPPDRYHAWTKLVPATGPGDAQGAEFGEPKGAGTRAREPAAPSTETSDTARDERTGSGDGAAKPLARRGDPGVAVEQAIRQRRSARVFTSDAIAAEDLGFVLDAALAHPPLRDAPVRLRAFVHRAQGIAPGLYRVRRSTTGGPELVLVRSGDLSEALVDVCLGQDKAGEAAAGIAIVGDLEAAVATGGDRGYRDLCIESGGVAQRIYLAAESCGIAARNLSAFVDERLNELAELDGRRHAVLHLTMLGPGN